MFKGGDAETGNCQGPRLAEKVKKKRGRRGGVCVLCLIVLCTGGKRSAGLPCAKNGTGETIRFGRSSGRKRRWRQRGNEPWPVIAHRETENGRMGCQSGRIGPPLLFLPCPGGSRFQVPRPSAFWPV